MLVFSMNLFAQDISEPAAEPKKFALVIGNGNYSGLSRLANPVNDANDIAVILEHLGFTVDVILNGSRDWMDAGVIRLYERLSADKNSYGFFFYAGHGVQSGGENFLIPVNASIPNENFLRDRAVSVQSVLGSLNDAGNSLNVVVLDACRDNPFGWSRSGSRGLQVVQNQPADSIIVYATSAGQTAADGEGRNGLFTSQLLANLATPGLEVKEVFNRTGADVAELSGRRQIPAIYNQFFGTAYLGDIPEGVDLTIRRPAVMPQGMGKAKHLGIDRYWSVGASIGSSFSAPWLIATVHGTVSPFKYMFVELGLDYGAISRETDAAYYSLYPFAHLAFFWPFAEKFGFYTGLGGGAFIVSYKFDGEDPYLETFPAVSFTAGMNLFNMLDISYTLKTNFKGIIHKAALGYVYRFK